MVLSADPEGRFSFSQVITGQEDPFNGWDNFQMSRIETVGMKYLDKHDGVMEEYRSFYQGIPTSTWIGYSGQNKDHMRFISWWLAFHDSGIAFYTLTGYDIYPNGMVSPTNLLGPSLDHTGRSLALRDQMADLKRGIGRLILKTPRSKAQIALLSSYPSMLTSWCESSNEVNSFILYHRLLNTHKVDSRNNSSWFWRKASKAMWEGNLEQASFAYDYISSQNLTDESLEGYRILILPYCIALSPEECGVIKRFVKQGNTVIADLRPGIYDEHGKVYKKSLLSEMFGVAFPQEEKQPSFIETELTLAAKNQESLSCVAIKTPVLSSHSFGKGKAYLLNAIPLYSSSNSSLLGELLSSQGVEPQVLITKEDGTLPVGIECVEKRDSLLTIYGIMSDYKLAKDKQELCVIFPEKKHTYDLRQRKYIGQVNQVKLALSSAETAVFAQLPYQVKAVELTGDKTCQRGKIWNYTVKIKASNGKVGNHVFHIIVSDPTRNERFCYTKNVKAENGIFKGSIPMAINDTQGKWTITVEDVISSAKGKMSFNLKE